MLRDAEFDFTQRQLTAARERKSDFIQLSSLQSYDKRERALAWMKIETVLFESWTLHHYDGTSSLGQSFSAALLLCGLAIPTAVRDEPSVELATTENVTFSNN